MDIGTSEENDLSPAVILALYVPLVFQLPCAVMTAPSSNNTKADGSGTSYKDQQSVVNFVDEQGNEITLYAQWEKEIYKVIFDTCRYFSFYRDTYLTKV